MMTGKDFDKLLLLLLFVACSNLISIILIVAGSVDVKSVAVGLFTATSIIFFLGAAKWCK